MTCSLLSAAESMDAESIRRVFVSYPIYCMQDLHGHDKTRNERPVSSNLGHALPGNGLMLMHALHYNAEWHKHYHIDCEASVERQTASLRVHVHSLSEHACARMQR